jgi:hypothetical protein
MESIGMRQMATGFFATNLAVLLTVVGLAENTPPPLPESFWENFELPTDLRTEFARILTERALPTQELWRAAVFTVYGLIASAASYWTAFSVESRYDIRLELGPPLQGVQRKSANDPSGPDGVEVGLARFLFAAALATTWLSIRFLVTSLDPQFADHLNYASAAAVLLYLATILRPWWINRFRPPTR